MNRKPKLEQTITTVITTQLKCYNCHTGNLIYAHSNSEENPNLRKHQCDNCGVEYHCPEIYPIQETITSKQL